MTLTTGLVFANDIISFLKNMFSLNSINIDNESITNAVVNKNYVQNVNDEYIDIELDYKFKIEYLMIDDVNLYMVFDLYSNNDIDKKYRFEIPDLTITSENNEELLDKKNIFRGPTYYVSDGWKKIETENQNERKELMFLVSNGFEKIKYLNIKFSCIKIYD